jgi:hypothetical protein
MNFKAIMMQKNENILLPVWVNYHTSLFGAENVYIFDNGSTDSLVIKQLNAAEARGVHVIRDRNTKEDFANKGEIVAAQIRALDESNPADFYFPLDCDEFAAIWDPDETFGFDRLKFEEALTPFLNSPHVLMIRSGFDNFPGQPGVYIRKTRRKCFFARGACLSLDLGFHRGRARESEEAVITPLVHFHLHYRPFAQLQASARQKMEGRVDNFERETLLAHQEARGKGIHLVEEILFEDEAEYHVHFATKYARSRVLTVPGLADQMAAAGSALPY